MNTFLFAHNPEEWQWENLDNAIRDITEKGSHPQKWSISSYKQKCRLSRTRVKSTLNVP